MATRNNVCMLLMRRHGSRYRMSSKNADSSFIEYPGIDVPLHSHSFDPFSLFLFVVLCPIGIYLMDQCTFFVCFFGCRGPPVGKQSAWLPLHCVYNQNNFVLVNLKLYCAKGRRRLYTDFPQSPIYLPNFFSFIARLVSQSMLQPARHRLHA